MWSQSDFNRCGLGLVRPLKSDFKVSFVSLATHHMTRRHQIQSSWAESCGVYLVRRRSSAKTLDIETGGRDEGSPDLMLQCFWIPNLTVKKQNNKSHVHSFNRNILTINSCESCERTSRFDVSIFRNEQAWNYNHAMCIINSLSD